MSDEAKTIVEIEERHAHDIDALNSEPDKRWRLGAYTEKLIDDRAKLLAIVNRQQKREAALREAAEGGCVALDECADILRGTFPSLADHVIGPVAEKIRKALAGGPTNG